VIGDAALRTLLADQWGLGEVAIEVHNGGMNSATWFVGAGGARWVVKAVPAQARRPFAAGLAVAARLEAAGIPAGAPVATRRGQLVADAGGVPLALLTWVPGGGLTGNGPGEQRLIGTTLVRVHRALRNIQVEGAERFHWVDPRAERLAVRPWVRPRVAEAVRALDELGHRSLSQGLLHTDPAPKAFRLDRSKGVCGLIDWSTAMTGPLLYDPASAVMYVGGPERAEPLVQAYLEHAPVPRAEVERGLLVMLRFRGAVQADYFAHRIAADDLTGIASAGENEVGLEHARGMLTGPGR
jgi:homoserine kinase type II